MSADPSRQTAVVSRSLLESLEGRTFLSASTDLLGGDAYAPAATGATYQPAVAKSSSRTYLKSLSGASTTFGAPVQLVASVTRRNGSPITAGTVTFKTGTTVLGTFAVNLKGKAVLATGALPVGNDAVTATFNGTKKFYASTSASVSHAVAKANTTTTIAQADSTTVMGVPAVFTATVTAVKPGGGVPAGNVEFRDNGTLIATVALNKKGRAVLSVPDFFIGNHAISAKYVGTSGYNTSTSTSKNQTVSEGTFTTQSGGNQVSTRVAGVGTAAAKTGDSLVVNYTGYLTNGTKFDSSLNPGRTPFTFTLGGNVIAGWNQGLVGIKWGETRVLKVPPSLAYGAAGQGNIPPNATLYFVVTRLGPTLAVGGKNVNIPSGAAASTTYGTSFGSVTVGKSSAASTIQLASVGDPGLNFTANPGIVSSDAAEFLVGPLTGGANGPTFTVTFKPKSKGTHAATITILTNDLAHPKYTFQVSGVGA